MLSELLDSDAPGVNAQLLKEASPGEDALPGFHVLEIVWAHQHPLDICGRKRARYDCECALHVA